MKKRSISLLLAGALALTLCACASAGEGPSPSPAAAPSAPASTEPSGPALATPTPEPSPAAEPSVEPTPSPEPTAPPETAAGNDLPGREYQPWQVGYMDFLTALLQAEQDVRGGEEAFGGLAVDGGGVKLLPDEWPNVWNAMEMGSEHYSLYDVDKDGQPELFVQYGSCEANFTTQCYAYRDGEIVCIGEFHTGHSNLYTHPDKSAVLRSEGHMGYAELYEYPMEGGVLTEERVLFTEEDVWDYTPVDEIVPGAEYIEYFYTRGGAEDDSYWTGRTPYSLGKALLLPIADYYDGRPATGNNSEQARAAILAALSGEGEVYGASGDHFNGDVGPMPWEEYVQTVTAVPNAQVTADITSHFWQDMNGDGQEECVLHLESEIRRGEETWSGEDMVMLSEQDGVVYAYCFDFYERDDFCTDGTIRNYDGRLALSFWKDQCYQYAVPDTSAPAVKWVDGAPAG